MNLQQAVASTRVARSKVEAKPDLTMLYDWQEVWPDPLEAPDFPPQPDPHNAPLSRQRAVERLARLSLSLNGQKAVRPPTDEERAQIIAQLDKRDASGRQRFMARQAMEVRAYLAKLDARAKRNEATDEARAKELAARNVAAFKARMDRPS